MKKKKTPFIKIFASVITIFACICITVFPERYIPSAKKGILLWANNVLPVLFPFFFCTALLTKIGALDDFGQMCDKPTKKLFRCGGETAYVFLMSIISGYPVGAKLISELYAEKRIDKYEATRASCLCSTSGPLFVIGTVGTCMFGNKSAGYILFATHIFSALICGKIFCFYGDFNKSYVSRKKQREQKNALYECVYSSIISILVVGGFICVFYVLSDILGDFKITYPLEFVIGKIIGNINAQGLIKGLIECTNGCSVLSKSPSALSVSLACGLISFGGLSVLFQSIVFLKKAKVNVGIFILSKIIQFIVSMLLCFIVVSIINVF